MALEERNDPANIILLCPTCHVLVDAMNATDIFTPDLLRQWKADHERRVRHGAAIPQFESREQLDDAITRLNRENYGIWRNLGPESPAGRDRGGRGVDLWRERVRNTILPNNRRILELVDANIELLTDKERAVVEDFRVHAAAFDLNYSSGQWRAGAPTFPSRFAEIFEH
jgi:hypothetical protein